MATGISTSFVPRKEAQELGGLTIKGEAPNVGIANFTRGVNVTPQQAVQFGAPYVSTQQTANFIQSLGQFNDAVRSFGISYNKYDTEQNAMQGEADALGADPEVQRKIFREGLDKAVKDGLFPENAHPVYRMNFIQTAAKAQAYQTLPDELAKTAEPLISAENTEPIGGVLSKKVIDNANQLPDILSRKAYIETGLQLARQTQQQAEAQRLSLFRGKKTENATITAAGSVRELATAIHTGNENDIPLFLAGAQAQFNNIRNQNISNPSGVFFSSLSETVEGMVKNREISPSEGEKALEYAVNSITTQGTNTLGSIPDIQEKYQQARHRITVFVDQQGETAMKERDRRDKAANETLRDYFVAAQDAGQAVNRRDFIVKAAKELESRGFDYNHAFRLARAMGDEVTADAVKRPSDAGVEATLTQLATDNPDMAEPEIAQQEAAKTITRKKAAELRQIAAENRDTQADFKNAGASVNDTDSMVDQLFQQDAALSKLLAVKDENAMYAYNTIRSTAQQTYITLANQGIKELKAQDPDGKMRKENPPLWREKVVAVINEAKSKASQDAIAMKKDAKEHPFVNDPTFGPQWSADVSLATRLIARADQDPSKFSVANRYTVANFLPKMRNMEQVAMLGNETEKKQATASLDRLHHTIGVNPVDFVNGKTKNGFPIDASKFDKSRDAFFQNVDQWNAVMGEYAKVGQLSPDFEKTTGFKLLSKLGIDPYSDEATAFLLRQKALVELRSVPSLNALQRKYLSK